jgi:hypothetical protein
MVLAGSVGPAVAGPMVERGSYDDSGTFESEWCARDWDGTWHVKGRYWVHSDRDGVPLEAYHEIFKFTNAYVADNGDAWQIKGKANLTGDEVVEHVEGNIYRITTTQAGNVWGIYSANGRSVWRDRGLLVITELVDTKGDDDPTNDDVAFEDIVFRGPHILFDDFEPGSPFCEYVDEAIALG